MRQLLKEILKANGAMTSVKEAIELRTYEDCIMHMEIYGGRGKNLVRVCKKIFKTLTNY